MRGIADVLTVLIVVLLAFGGAGCRRENKCLPTCEQRAKDLGCLRPQGCKQECEDLRTHAVCRGELDRFASCFLKEPKERWHCDEHGTAMPKLDTCAKERGAIEQCIQSLPMPQNPPQTL